MNDHYHIMVNKLGIWQDKPLVTRGHLIAGLEVSYARIKFCIGSTTFDNWLGGKFSFINLYDVW